MTKEKKKERKNPSEIKKPKDTNDDDVILFNDEIKSKKIEINKKNIFSLSLLVKPLTQTNNKLDEGLRNLTFKSEDKLKIKKKIEIIDDSDEEERIQVKFNLTN